MRTHIARHHSIAATVALCALAAPAAGLAAAPAAAVSPYTLTGRVMDSHHAAFDTNRVCVLRACDEDENVIAQTQSTFLEGIRENYALKIPVATAEADDYATQNNPLEIVATDDTGNTWRGVVPDAICGAAGTLRRVDIVLGSDEDGDGIDDALFDELAAQWEASEFWRNEDFDPRADHDGDGVPTIDEAYAGTNPFDPEDSLRITSFAATAANGHRSRAGDAGSNSFELAFPAIPGRAYSVETTTNLASGAWSSTPFILPGANEEDEIVSIPSSKTGDVVPVTLYLLPSDDAARFYRVRLE